MNAIILSTHKRLSANFESKIMKFFSIFILKNSDFSFFSLNIFENDFSQRCPIVFITFFLHNRYVYGIYMLLLGSV